MAAEDRRIWLDGALVPWAEATVHVLSQSLQRGSLVFDVMQVCPIQDGPAVFGLREHLERFQRSAATAGMTLGLDLDALLAGVRAAVQANPGCEVVKVSAYHDGLSLDVLPVDPRPRVAIAAFAAEDIVPGGISKSRNARLQIAAPPKMPARVLSPQIKIAASYTHAAIAKQKAREQGFHDVLFLDDRGNLAESSTQSFFVVSEGVLRTAPVSIVLAGVTRRAVMELAQDEGLLLKEEPLPGQLLVGADEAFLTGTSTGVWPVEKIDAHALPAPVPGPVTACLLARFERMIAGDDPVFSPKWIQKV